jgi:hypothetical protein
MDWAIETRDTSVTNRVKDSFLIAWLICGYEYRKN